MAIMTHAKFYFNQLMLTLSFGIWASAPPTPPGPGERLKRSGLIGLRQQIMVKIECYCAVTRTKKSISRDT